MDPDVASTVCFLDIVIVQCFRHGMGKKLPLKIQNDSIIASFCLAIWTMVSCTFHERWEAGVWNQGTFRILLCILLTSCVEFIIESKICRVFSYTDVGLILENIFCLAATNWRVQNLPLLYTHDLGQKNEIKTHRIMWLR